MLIKVAVSALAAASVVRAGGGGQPPKQTPPAPPAANSAEVRISSELAPPGGTVQVKFSLTNPQPIMSGGTGFSSYSLNGVAMWSPLGDVAGVALQRNGYASIFAVSPQGDLGTATDYPFLTVTMAIPPTVKAGTTLPVDLTPATSFVNAAGPVSLTTKPGTITVGGNFSINEIRPGGGTYPAGAVIRVEGQGFLPNAVLRTPQMRFSSYKVVSSTEIEFVLKEQTTLDAQAIQVTSGGFTQMFYAYLRGKPLQPPSRPLLKDVDPIFQQLTHALAQAGPFGIQDSGQYVAIALQNPNPGPAAVTLTLTHRDGSKSANLIVLPSGARIMDDMAALVGANAIQDGDLFNLISTAAIQILGINADETAGTVKPFLPSF